MDTDTDTHVVNEIQKKNTTVSELENHLESKNGGSTDISLAICIRILCIL